jgi:hypothetical protein
VADKQELHFAAAIDEHGVRIGVQEVVSLAGFEMFHAADYSLAIRRAKALATMKSCAARCGAVPAVGHRAAA